MAEQFSIPAPAKPIAIGSGDSNDKPYNSEKDGVYKRNVAGDILSGIAKPFVQAGISIIDPIADTVNMIQGKQVRGGYGVTLKSKFLGGEDGYVYSFLDQTAIKTDRLSERFNKKEISLAQGLLGAAASGVEPSLDLGTAVWGGGTAKELLEQGVKTSIKLAVTRSLKESIMRGGAIAGAYDVVDQLEKADDYNVMRTLAAVGLGTAVDIGITRGLPALVVNTSKAGKFAYDLVPNAVKDTVVEGFEKVSGSKLGQVATTFFGNKTTLLRKQFGEVGERVSSMFERAYKRMNEDVGKFHLGLVELGLVKAPQGAGGKFRKPLERWADKEFRFDVRDALGRTGRFADDKAYKAALEADADLKGIVNFFDTYRKDKGLLGQQMNIVDNLEDIDTYFSRYTPHVELRSRVYKQLQRATTDAEREAIYASNSDAVADMVEYGFTREGKWKSKLEAYKTYYDAMDVSLEQGRVADGDNAYFQWLVKNGQASDIADAKTRFIGDLDRGQGTLTPRIASFDYERSVPMPWNDPDPVRVMTKYIEDTNKRLAYTEQFGANDEIINDIVNTLKNEKGVTQANKLVDVFRRLTGQVERKPASQRLAALITNVETLRLFASALLNIPQALLYAMPTDFSSFSAGLRSVLGKKSIVESLERGVYLSDLARQTRTVNTFDQRMADTVMKYSGFGYLDMMVKSMGSGVADTWAQKNLRSLEMRLGRNFSEVDRAKFIKEFGDNEAFNKKALREGYNVQKESAKAFNEEFKGEDFKAVAGEQGRARAYSNALDSLYSKEVARLENAKGTLEKTLMRTGKQFSDREEEVQAIVADIKELRESIAIYQGDNDNVPVGLEAEFSQRQVEEGLAEAKRLLIESMNKRVAELTEEFDAARAVGMAEAPSFSAPQKTTEQKVAEINEKIKAVNKAIEDAGIAQERKKLLLNNIADSYAIASDRMSKENPDIMAYRSRVAGQKAEFSAQNLKQYREYHYLKELGIDPEEVLARGHLSKDDLAIATQTLVEQTQGSQNPLMTPLFAESPAGRVFYQFKKLVLQQSLFFGKQIKRNIFSKDTRSAGNAIRFLTVAFAIYPPTMGVIRDLRDLAVGKKNPDEMFHFDKYYTDLNVLSATGLFMDFAKSFDNGRELDFFAPVAISDAVTYLRGTFDTGKGAITGNEDQALSGLEALYKQAVKQTGVGNILLNFTKKE